MRVPKEQLEFLKKNIIQFAPDAKVYLFGSRVDDHKRGGDIDILTQKLFPSIFLILAENPVTFIDKCQLAEKIGVIKSANDLIEMRRLRNEIAHEYRAKDYCALFIIVRQRAEILCSIIDEVGKYVVRLITGTKQIN